MNVTCPNCATVYRIDPAKVPEAGVRARCAVCNAVFAVRRDGDQGGPIAASPAKLDASPAAAAPSRPELGRPAAAAPPKAEPPRPLAPAAAPRPAAPAAAPVGAAPRPATPATPAAPAAPSAPQRPAAPVARSVAGGPAVPAAAAAPARAAAPAAPASPPEAARAAPPVAPAAPKPSAPAGGAPGAPAPRPAASPGNRPANPFLSQDPTLKAKRLARALISDMVVYHPAKRQEGLRDGNLKALFEEEIKKSWEEYAEQVGREVAESTAYFREALNEILAGGRQVF